MSDDPTSALLAISESGRPLRVKRAAKTREMRGQFRRIQVANSRETGWRKRVKSAWVGYLFVLSDEPGSRKPVGISQPNFESFAEFVGASYAKRYELLCRRLVLERHYDAACFITTDRTQAKEADNYVEPAVDLSAERFLDELVRQVARR